MPKIIRVAKAQQRYETVPVLDAEGNRIKVPVLKKNGQPKTTKSGREVTMTKTVADKTRPKPLLRCDFPGCDINDREIAIGSPYKHMTVMKGSPQKNRHAEHRDWFPWEYSSALWALVAQAQHGMYADIEGLTDPEDFESVRDSLVEAAQALLDDKEEALSAMPETLASGSQVEEQRDALEAWVESIGEAEAPDDLDEPEARFYIVDKHNGDQRAGDHEGYEIEQEANDEIASMLEDDPEDERDDERYDVVEETPEEHDEEALEEWLEAARESLTEAVDGFEG